MWIWSGQYEQNVSSQLAILKSTVLFYCIPQFTSQRFCCVFVSNEVFCYCRFLLANVTCADVNTLFLCFLPSSCLHEPPLPYTHMCNLTISLSLFINCCFEPAVSACFAALFIYLLFLCFFCVPCCFQPPQPGFVRDLVSQSFESGLW